MLRASSEHNQQSIDLKAVIGQGDGDGGVPHGPLLVEFAEAVTGRSAEAVHRMRPEIARLLGPAALVDAAAVCAIFNALDRVADSTGIPLEAEKAAATETMRGELGIDRFAAMRG